MEGTETILTESDELPLEEAICLVWTRETRDLSDGEDEDTNPSEDREALGLSDDDGGESDGAESANLAAAAAIVYSLRRLCAEEMLRADGIGRSRR